MDLGRSEDVREALSLSHRQTYPDLRRSKDVLLVLSMIRQMYLDLGSQEDVLLALSMLRETYLDLKRSEDVMTALSVLMMEMDEFKAL